MDIPRTDSPIVGFEFPSASLTRPASGWIRALPSTMPADGLPDESDELGTEAAADLAALVHHLSFADYSFPPHRHSSSRSSLASLASIASSSGSTICYTPCSSVLHTPTSSVDNPFATQSLAKSRSFASLSTSPSARREAVYIVEDDDDDEEDMSPVQFPYGMGQDSDDSTDSVSVVAEDNPSSRFSFDEDERPRSTNIRDLWTRSRAMSMSTPSVATPAPSSQRAALPPMPPMPPAPPTSKKNKRKTTFSMLRLSMLHISF